MMWKKAHAAERGKLPIPWRLGCMVVFEIAAWLSTSGTVYDSSRGGLWLSTAGWFIMGQVIIVPCALLYATIFGLIARLISQRTARISAMIISTSAVVIAGLESLPQNRFRAIVGKQVAAKANLIRLTTFDSFNDGITSIGEFRASKEVMDSLVEVRGLQKWSERNQNIFVAYFPKLYGHVSYADDCGHFAYDSEMQIVYFVVRSRPIRSPS